MKIGFDVGKKSSNLLCLWAGAEKFIQFMWKDEDEDEKMKMHSFLLKGRRGGGCLYLVGYYIQKSLFREGAPAPPAPLEYLTGVSPQSQ